MIIKVNDKFKINYTQFQLLLMQKITNSSGLFTGVRNLTIDNAPIIPNDNAMLLDIRVVMIEVIGGNKQNVKV